MQIIQSIRDKGALITVILIGMCIIGFILMDSRQGGATSLFSGNSQTVGKVNGSAIDLPEFTAALTRLENDELQRTQQQPGSEKVNQMRSQVWDQLTAERIFFAEAEKLGITLTAKELSEVLTSNDPTNPLTRQPQLMDPATGMLDMAKAMQEINAIKKLNGAQKDEANARYIDPVKISAAVNKYNGMLNASAYYPTWMQEKDNADSKNFAVISYVSIPYSDISDSAVKVTDADVNEYVKKHANLFKQEAGRTISYISFSQLPTAADSAKQREEVEKLRASFAATDTNYAAFVARSGSTRPFVDDFLPKSMIRSAATDTITKAPVGEIFGPYIDGDSYALSKIIATKPLPDSVHARHILIPVNDPQTGKPINTDAAAKQRADSLLGAIKAGADFGALAAQFSVDESKGQGGDLGTFDYGRMASLPELNEFLFTKPAGSTEVLKTQIGYHIINIISQKDFNPAYKIAIVAKLILPSPETLNRATQEANKAAQQGNAAALGKYAADKGLRLIQLPGILKENDYTVGSLRDARPLVRWAFENKKGAVTEQPFVLGDEVVVATVDNIYKEGLQDAATARSGAEVIIRKEKKAKIILEKLGASPTLEKAAQTYGKQILQAGADSSITFNSQMINGLGLEQKLIGAAFNKEYQSKPTPAIEGTTGVFVMKVNSIGSKPADSPQAIAQQVAGRLNAIRSQNNNWFEGLKKQATIKDSRSKFF
jgi:peptidyl-prolyl cis-trans isomerase D